MAETNVHLEGALPASQRFSQPLSRKAVRQFRGPGSSIYPILSQLAVEDVYVFGGRTHDFEYLDTNFWRVWDSTNGTPFAVAADGASGLITAQLANTDNAWVKLLTVDDMEVFNTDHRPTALISFRLSEFDQYIATTDSTATLDGAINASVVTFTTSDNTVFTAGTTVIFIDSEFMLVLVVDSGGFDITVTRGYGGTTAASHTDTTTIYLREAGDKLKVEWGFMANEGDADDSAEDADAGQVATKSTPASNVNDYAVAILDTDDNRYWDVMSDVGGTVTTSNKATGRSWDDEDDVFQTLMVATNEQDEAYAWINGDFIGKTTGGPGANVALGLFFMFQNREAPGGTRDCEIDYLRAWQERTPVL